MASVEKRNSTAVNFSGLFLKNAYAQSGEDIAKCAVIAVGADILWSLGAEEGVEKWSKKAIKKVAQRALGPIGVAIAVVSSGVCVYGAS